MDEHSSSQATSANKLVALNRYIVLDKDDTDVSSLGLSLFRGKTEIQLVAGIVLGYEKNSVQIRGSVDLHSLTSIFQILWAYPWGDSSARIPAKICGADGDANMLPATATSSIPAPTKPACAGS